MSKREDSVRLRHMLDAGREALAFAEGETRAALEADRKLALALLKCIEILGEAASRVSPETQESHPEVPWKKIIAMRNRLIHGYYEIDLDLVWDTISTDIPPLMKSIQKLLQ